MKLKTSFAVSVIALCLTAMVRAEDIKINVPGSSSASAAKPAASAPAVSAPVAAPAAVATYSDAQVLEALGWVTYMNSPFPNFGLNPSQEECFVKGLVAATQAKECPYGIEKIGPSMQSFMQRKYAEAIDAMKKKNAADSVAYFAKLKEDKKVVFLPSGLAYEVIQPGTGDYPKATDTVKVNYTGKLTDGTVFDSNQQPDQPYQPVAFELSKVIPGFTEGLQKINRGGKIRLHIPAQLAYGENPDPRSGIPPLATLVFDIELVDVSATAPAAPAAAK